MLVYNFCWTVTCSVFVFRRICVMLVIVFAGLWTVICSVFRWVCIMLVYSFYWTVVCFQMGLCNAGL